MDHLLVLLLLWSSGVQAEEKHKTTESDYVRLVGGASGCAGTLELKHLGEWRPVDGNGWTLKEAAVVCEHLDCGSAVYVEWRNEYPDRPVWKMKTTCIQSGSAVRDCVTSKSSSAIVNVTCTDSVRLLNGSSLCSGRLEVKSNQSWSSVCEADFDQQDAEVVCRELGCGPPSVLQGALYGEVEAPVWSKEFQCGGHESALLDCRSSASPRNSCSPGKAVGLTCSEPVRLVGQASRCAGMLEVKVGKWRTIDYFDWDLKEAHDICEHLGCGSAFSIQWKNEPSEISVLKIEPDCVHSGSALRDCAKSHSSFLTLNVTCKDMLVQPIISVSFMNGVSMAQQQGPQLPRGSNFTISCSIQPQNPGGSFQLTFTSSDTAYNYTQPAVNHSAHFLFPAAKPAHQGNYSCIYHVYDLSSESRLLSVTVSDPTHSDVVKGVVITLVVLLVIVLMILGLHLYHQVNKQ
ncbi:scavenger receptor cysteine-rich type 1 protein M130-like isoform X2 [Pelmatolapia mariae]|uniref:scavenger receptor cysteine-rich type 1 protein M130-like isoform X2 n=1 Tax=Pelmatolapia mariae TaxID=158779 RepID=UPI002FE6BD6B